MSMVRSEAPRMNEGLIIQLQKEYEPILVRIEALQSQYQKLIAELEKAASAGRETRAELGDSLNTALEMNRKAMVMDHLALIKDRKFASEPSGENLEAIRLANKRNEVPDDQKEIQMMLHVPKDIQANYKQLVVSVQGGADISDLIKISVEQSEKQLAEFQIFLENQ